MLVVHLLIPSLSCIIEANTIQNVLSRMLLLVSIPVELANNCAVHHDRSEPSTLQSVRPKPAMLVQQNRTSTKGICSDGPTLSG